MYAAWRSLRWLFGKLLFFSALLIGAILLIRIPALLAPGAALPGRPAPPVLSSRSWLDAVGRSLTELAHGRLIPPVTDRMAVRFWQETARSVWPELLVTLKLMGTALVIGAVLGLTFGWLMSRLGPARFRRGAFGMTTLVGSVPDLLLATFFDLLLVLGGKLFGIRPYAPDLAFYHKYLGPALALSLLIAPYIARITAAAIGELAGQLFVRTALAKGLPYPRVLLVHIGKNVLIHVCSVLPVVTGILVSGTVMVEYMTEVRGLGRGLVLLLAPLPRQGYYDPAAAFLKLLPLLVLLTLVSALTEAGLRWLDPRRRGAEATLAVIRPAGPRPRGRLVGARAGSWNPIRLVTGLGGALSARWVALPGRLLAALKALRDPVLLSGTLLVLLLVSVAIFAPQIAPYPVNKASMAYQDAAGKIWVPPSPPEPKHLFGTDGIGRDVFSQLIYGTRYALLLAALVVPARFALALFLGLAAAWWGGLWERIVRWLGVFFTAVPQMLVPLIAVSVFNRALANNVPASLAWGVFWVALPAIPRLAGAIRQMALTTFTAPFLESAVAAGAGPGRILFRHVLPQMWPQLWTMAALEVPLAMTLTATLSYFRTVPGGWIADDNFRGVPALPEWGSMMDIPVIIVLSGRWWYWAPFAALFVAVLAFNLVGEGLRRRSSASASGFGM